MTPDLKFVALLAAAAVVLWLAAMAFLEWQGAGR